MSGASCSEALGHDRPGAVPPGEAATAPALRLAAAPAGSTALLSWTDAQASIRFAPTARSCCRRRTTLARSRRQSAAPAARATASCGPATWTASARRSTPSLERRPARRPAWRRSPTCAATSSARIAGSWPTRRSHDGLRPHSRRDGLPPWALSAGRGRSVHHGCGGTTTLATLAGVSQVVMPAAFNEHAGHGASGMGAAHAPGSPDVASPATALDHAPRRDGASRAAERVLGVADPDDPSLGSRRHNTS